MALKCLLKCLWFFWEMRFSSVESEKFFDELWLTYEVLVYVTWGVGIGLVECNGEIYVSRSEVLCLFIQFLIAIIM